MPERENKRRLFVGVLLGDAPRAQCAAVSDRLRRTGFDAKYEAAEKLHVTLAFLGNVAVSQYDGIAQTLIESAAGSAPLQIALDRLGAFPHERKPRVVYIGARAQGAPFRKLAENVQSAYAALGFAFKEDPVAHVTIARVKDPSRALTAIEFAAILVQVREITLFESLFDPKRTTTRYEPRESAPLSLSP